MEVQCPECEVTHAAADCDRIRGFFPALARVNSYSGVVYGIYDGYRERFAVHGNRPSDFKTDWDFCKELEEHNNNNQYIADRQYWERANHFTLLEILD